ncbi:hypothetical protein IE81DRAFT_367941 [Ceraceosorus guamensis]|uniref:Uncharacterized protein n=1 Tax=Ceraceosorus guamensis TaxID=1522189 RepID=A0A316VTG8_9BASI|nr:hypothetical protein IE81DRAFT_367941 [Ceraceosorus guamensis]PWN40899.1 hypothetical protein IE81DRAFT_367941 [Ceraceosorus guamensis]
MATSSTGESLEARVANLTDKIKVAEYESRAPLSRHLASFPSLKAFCWERLRSRNEAVGSSDADEDGDSDDGYAPLWNQLNLVHLSDKDRAFIQEYEGPWTRISRCNRFERWSREIFHGVQEKQGSIAGDARIRDERVRSFLLSTAVEDEESVLHHMQVNTERRAEWENHLEERFDQLADPCVQAMEELVDSPHAVDSDSEDELWRIGGNVLDARVRLWDRMRLT